MGLKDLYADELSTLMLLQVEKQLDKVEVIEEPEARDQTAVAQALLSDMYCIVAGAKNMKLDVTKRAMICILATFVMDKEKSLDLLDDIHTASKRFLMEKIRETLRG